MKFSLLLFALYQILMVAALTSSTFKKYIGKACARVLIKTENGKYARLFIVDKGKVRFFNVRKIGRLTHVTEVYLPQKYLTGANNRLTH